MGHPGSVQVTSCYGRRKVGECFKVAVRSVRCTKRSRKKKNEKRPTSRFDSEMVMVTSQ